LNRAGYRTDFLKKPAIDRNIVACVVVSFRDRNGRLGSATTAGDSLFQACSNALDFFRNDFWKGLKPGANTILEVMPVRVLGNV
jgi:hypothetical protein